MGKQHFDCFHLIENVNNPFHYSLCAPAHIPPEKKGKQSIFIGGTVWHKVRGRNLTG